MDAVAQARRLRVGVTWNLAPLCLLALVGLGLNFAIGGFWGPAALGSFNQVTSAYFILSTFGAVGINFSVLRAVAEKPEDSARVGAIVLGGLIPSALLGVLVTAIFVAVRFPVGELLGSDAVAEGIPWAAPGLFCFVVNKLLLGVVNGLSRMRAFAVYTSLRYLLIAVGLIIARVTDLPAARLPAIWSFSEGLLMLVLLVEVAATVSFRHARAWAGWLRDHLSYGARGVAATLLFEVNSRLDIWMLGPVFSDTMLGIYSMAASMAEGAAQLAVVLQVNINPRLAADLAAGRVADVEALVQSSRRWFVPLMGLLALAGAALYPFVIPWLTGRSEFAGGAWPFALLMAALVVSAAWLPFNQILLMGARPGWHTIYVAIGVALNVVGCFLLIPIFGLVGAALSCALATILSSLLLRPMAAVLVNVRL